MKTHSSATRRTCALSLFALLVVSTSGRLGAATDLSTHFPKVSGQESGDYLGSLSDQGAGSGITWWPDRNTYLILDNNGQRILEVERTTPPVTASTLVRTITLTGFQDAEDIHWIPGGDGNTFVIALEYNTDPEPDSKDEIVVLTIPEGEDDIAIDIDDDDPETPETIIRRLQFTNLGTPEKNKGIEAIALIGNYFYFTTEWRPSPSAWNVFRTENTGSGPTPIVNPARPVAFSINGFWQNQTRDISGMATDGTYLWLLSDEGAPGAGRLLKLTTAGDLVTDYTLPALPNPHIWNQAEGIELFTDSDGLTKILLTGERDQPGGGAGVDFMTLTSTRSTITITANDNSAGEPEGATTYPGQFTVTRTDNNNLIPLDVTFSTSASTASANQDYTSIGTTVQIQGGLLSRTINVTPLDDNLYEKDETVVAALTTNPKYTVHSVNHTATVTIQSIFELAGASSVYSVNDHGQAITDLGRHNADGTFAQSYAFTVYGINNAGDVVGNGYARIGSTTYDLGLFDGYGTTGLRINDEGDLPGNDPVGPRLVGYANDGSIIWWQFFPGSATLSSPMDLAEGGTADVGDDAWYGTVVGGNPGYYIHPYGYGITALPSATGNGPVPLGIGGNGSQPKIVGYETTFVPLEGGGYDLRDVPVMWMVHSYCPSCDYGVTLANFPASASADAVGQAVKINSLDIVVGNLFDAGGARAGLWQSDQWYFLNDVINDANWTFSSVSDLSESGHIIGTGTHNSAGRCFLIRR
jgi:uncharacterized protein YjiK